MFGWEWEIDGCLIAFGEGRIRAWWLWGVRRGHFTEELASLFVSG